MTPLTSWPFCASGFLTLSAPIGRIFFSPPTNRQEAVKRVAPVTDAMIVVGAPNSSNSQRLTEVARRAGCPWAALVQRAEEIDWGRFGALRTLGVTAGASAPERLGRAE